MESHVKIVGILNIVFGVLFLLAAFSIGFLLTGIGVVSNDSDASFVLPIIGSAISIFFGLLSLPGIIGGIGVVQHKNWGRIILIIIAIMDLFAFPIGTAIGAYTLWVLFNQDSIKLFNPMVEQ